MTNKNTYIVLFLSILGYPVFAQKEQPIQFYLSPHIGVEWTLSTFEDRKEKPPYITSTSPDLTDKYGISIVADFKRKFSLELGYGWGNVGWGLHFKSQTDSALNSISGRNSPSISVRRLSLKFVKPVTLVKIKRRKKNDFISTLLKVPKSLKYWAIFDVNILGGVSYERIPTHFVSGVLGIGSFGGTDAIGLNDNWNYKNAYGYGVYTGFSLQFYQLDKKRFELGFIYHKGLNKRIIVEWETSINGVEFPKFNTFTRGSMLAIYVAYPIKLFKIKSP